MDVYNAGNIGLVIVIGVVVFIAVALLWAGIRRH